MTFTALADIVLGLAVLVLLCVRQLRWTALRPAQLWRLPELLGAIGVVSIRSTGGRMLSATALALLVLELAVALSTGAAMGRITVFRPLRGAVPPLRTGEAVPTLECRTGCLGIALWAVLVAVRVGIVILGAHLGAAALESTGVILLTIAANRAARAAVIQVRLGTTTLAMAGR